MASVFAEVHLLRRFHSFFQKNKLLTRNTRNVVGGLRHHSFDPQDGKTTVTVLNRDEATLMINSFSTIGFRLNNGLMAIGPIAIFPKTVLSWNVKDADDINEDSLSLFYHLEPKIDILVLGVGIRGSKVSNSLIRFMNSKRINVEVLPTEQACSTFNFLNSEGRYIAGALIPPHFISTISDQDYIDAELRKKQLFLAREDE